MSILTKAFQTLAGIFCYSLLSMVLISCSGEDETDKHVFDHPHAKNIDMEKHLFEHEFTQQCVIKKNADLTNRDVDPDRISEQCMCIATYLFKDFTAKDSYALFNDKKHAQSLRNKYEEAAKLCL